MSDQNLNVVKDWHQEAPETPKSYQVSPDMQGEQEIIMLETKKCDHFYKRKNATEFDCAKCMSGWIDGGTFRVENGKIIL